MASRADPLALFHPRIAAWFRSHLGEPTEAQRLGWPRIAAGEHVLLTAPTGTGKTLAAFLWALDRLLTGAWPAGAVRVLYVSPLKALNTDVRRNLLAPLEALTSAWRSEGEEPPEVRVLTRSGDTPQEERQRMARRPPSILITTPESLNVLLTSRKGRAMLGGLATVILDEVHAVVGNKRGVHLITAVERLVRLSGEFQRIALSATVRPAEPVAEWLGGWVRADDRFERREVRIVSAATPKAMALSVRYPAAPLDPDARDAATSEELWASVVREVRASLVGNRSTLVFANSRRMVEKLTRLVNESAEEELVYSHHGSLSREVRSVVEERLKDGKLRGIVATNSLELGIDIGSLDEVVLVQTPATVASALQRIGRAGHVVGAVSRGRIVALVPRDLVAAAVVSQAVVDGAIEPLRPVVGALDVLAQVIVSMCCGETWAIEELFEELRRSHPYHEVPRRLFDLVLEMLSGRYATTRIRELRPLLSIDRVDGTVTARPGADRTVYLGGGTIPDRGYFHLRVADSGARLGELDEEFVWERSVGDSFTLGTQSWRIERITHNDVFVRPTRTRSAMAPFWRAEEQGRSFELAERIGRFLEHAEATLESPTFVRLLETEHAMEGGAALALAAFLGHQRAATGKLPHRHQLVVERVLDPQGKDAAPHIVLHTGWGGRVNRPFAMALAAAWEKRHGVPLEVMHDDDCVAVHPAAPLDAGELLSLVRSEDLEDLLRSRLERTGFFGARFREAAGRALLLPREGFVRRTPLWLSRQRAKELLETVACYDDFPIVLEAWRTCLVEEFDIAALKRVLDELSSGVITVHQATTDSPSPFASGVTWKRTNELMYEDDTPHGTPSRLRPDLVREVVLSSHLRPRVPRAVIETFRRKVTRIFPGWAPRDARELLDWLVERVVIPVGQWRELLAAMERDHGIDLAALTVELSGKAMGIVVPGREAAPVVAAVENVPRLLAAIGLAPAEVSLVSPALDGPATPEAHAGLARLMRRRTPGGEEGDPLVELAAEVLRFTGPVAPGFLFELLGVSTEREEEVLEQLGDAQRVIVDELTEGTEGPEICDTGTLERLLRITRAAARPSLEPLPLDRLPLFLANWQRLGVEGAGAGDLRAALERLFGLPAPVELWEGGLLPARLDPYVPGWLDALLGEGELLWLGCGEKRAAFALRGDRELFLEPARQVSGAGEMGSLFPHPAGRYSLEELIASSGLSSAEVSRRLWRLAWRGEASCDTFAALRKGIESRFAPLEPPPARGGRPGRRLRFDRWQSSRPFSAGWFPVPPAEPPADPLEEDELVRDRARILLDRYGVVFRELLEHELPLLRWGRVFRALRLLELSGEVVTGQFFVGVPGPQFASLEAVRQLREGFPEDRLWWLNASDPASPCGLGLEGLPSGLPRRLPSNHVVFWGSTVVVGSERGGRSLTITLGPDHPLLPEALRFIRVMLTRQGRPLHAVSVERINGETAAASAYRGVFEQLFHVSRDRTGLRLSRRY